MKIIPKIFTRDFPVLLCQIWGRRYKSFFGVTVKTAPNSIFIHQNGLVHNYRNLPYLHHEINGIFLDKLKEDPNFLKSFCDQYWKKMALLKRQLENILSRDDLLQFTHALCDLWQALYTSLYIYSDNRFSEWDREIVAEFRKKIHETDYLLFGRISSSLRMLYPKLGVLVKYIFWEELEANRIPSLAELTKRAQNRIIIYGDTAISESVFEGLKKELNFCLEEEESVVSISPVNEVRGQTAYRGKVLGTVRKVLQMKDASLLESGEVLVSYMTVPDFLPAMKKAAAFVTDEGGVTCHAAIMARELKKPCIIGTKIATKVLKDGDVVEVDAERGIVTVLERAKGEQKRGRTER